jgi:alkylation response protein AidB-like acyl-CoA dehydrogenase
LNEDQLQIQNWVHDFAANVMHPAAHEWDEREATPWPIIEEAAHVGLYSLDFLAHTLADPSGILLPIVMEEVAWGDAGLGLAIFGTGLAVAGIMASATPGRPASGYRSASKARTASSISPRSG